MRRKEKKSTRAIRSDKAAMNTLLILEGVVLCPASLPQSYYGGDEVLHAGVILEIGNFCAISIPKKKLRPQSQTCVQTLGKSPV